MCRGTIFAVHQLNSLNVWSPLAAMPPYPMSITPERMAHRGSPESSYPGFDPVLVARLADFGARGGADVVLLVLAAAVSHLPDSDTDLDAHLFHKIKSLRRKAMTIAQTVNEIIAIWMVLKCSK